MRRNANREERGGRLLSALAAAVLLTLLLGIIHRLYHCEYTDTDTPNDCFAVSAATGETALPKMVCLTFDDGPSKNTVPILEILDREQVPATFFVCAQDANERYLPLVADIAAAGHQIALHSATHQYSKIYASTDAFWQDIKALRQALEPYVDVGGIDWLRFPGGSTNTVSHRYGGRGIMKTLRRATTGSTGMSARRMPPPATPMRHRSCAISAAMPRGTTSAWCCCTIPERLARP